MMSVIVSLEALVSRIRSGDRLAVPVDYAGVSMAATPHIIAQGIDGLRLVCVPTGGMQVDMLIAAGLVTSVETSAISLGEAGGAPSFARAVKNGDITIMDATCPAIHAGLMAAQKGVPFLPMRGLIGTDVLANRKDWGMVDNPFSEGDRMVAIPAIHPDRALFHAGLADRHGNVWIGRRRELAAMAYASKETLVTVERIVDEDLLADEKTAAGVLPSLYVDAVAHAPGGAWPYACWGEYGTDVGALSRYGAAAGAGGDALTPWLSGAEWTNRAEGAAS